MTFPIHIPRVNNNDDEVRLVGLWVSPGEFVKAGTPLADIETGKATVTVEAEKDGYVLKLCGASGAIVKVGGVLLWMGESASEPVPQHDGVRPAAEVQSEPTLRAAMLLKQHRLDVAEIAASGDRITAEDVKRHIAGRANSALTHKANSEDWPSEPGEILDLCSNRRGMLRTVSWQKTHAVAAYAETTFNAGAWRNYAAEYHRRNALSFNPLFALLSWQLVQIVKEQPLLNSTMARECRYAYATVNLGFTVQSGEDLFVAVVRGAETMDRAAFAARLVALKNAALNKMLRPEEAQGATVGLSSMARFQATRHVPVLLPHTALMVAHAAPGDGAAVIGATYDHRVLTGSDAIAALQLLAEPRA
jgi:pyruvate/2-oxoglutarate dehydrogenase complex dihydrolipoamide acyltransferase (E2) component